MVESHSGANRIIAKCASKIYCNRFNRLGFSRVNGWWMSDDFMQTMKAALSFHQTGTRKVKVVCRCDGQNVTRRVNLPVAEVYVSESGLAKLGERVFDELPLSNGEICLHDIFSLLNIFKSVKKQSLALCCVQ